ncbi:CHAT domain-containing protein [Acrocarpospora pleiomorpha]|uniref:CHAT domain-containing protein n=1 Tax=Acrocarpospora pleiomorpha TaxID=90975 RepID=UPI0014780846|nr:CHAT domain-containing tetratricopeptide repeat protein [Acrocarpospora pleiomorpha]
MALDQAAPPDLPADLNDIMRALLESTARNEPDLRAAMLFNLGNVLLARSSRPGAEADLDTAIDRFAEAVQACPADHEDRAAILAGLGNALLIRSDLAAAVDMLSQAVDATPADHPERAARLINLGRALQSQPEHPRDAVFSVYAEAVRTASAAPSVRIEAARSAARIGPRAAELMETAVHLLPEVAPRQLDREDQQYALGGFAGLAADAAALTLADTGNSERASRALHLLEQGRTILLSQAMDTRSDLSDLRDSHPDLATRFAELRDLLDRTPATAITISSSVPPGSTTRDRHALAAEFSALIARIRRLDGFAGFMSPPSTDEILAEAAYGPVVVVNVSTYRSDALIVTTGGVVARELPGLTPEILVRQINDFHGALRGNQERQLQVLAWLWEVVAGPVLSVLGLRRDSGAWPRLWWAPGGLLGLLPLHAAGRQGDSVLDRVVSSYTPTVRGLRYAREQARRSAGTRALVVAMPTTPGKPGRLWQVPAEREMLRRRLPGAVVLSEPQPARPWRKNESDKLPTKANVLDELPTCSIAHFACHGTSDATNPSRSKLLLHDHASDPFTVASLGPVRLRSPRLAYLSACETALTSNTELVDEAIHLASAFQLAGYPHVVGTLWKVNDRAAFDIADMFYATLTEGGAPSHALHHAVRAAREYAPDDPSQWAAHVYSGA